MRHRLLVVALVCSALLLPLLPLLLEPDDVGANPRNSATPTFNGPRKFPDLEDPVAGATPALSAASRSAPWLALWLSGIAILTVVKAVRLGGFGVWVRRSSRGGASLERLLRSVEVELGMEPSAAIVTHPRARVPLLWGVHRPVIVIPTSMAEIPRDQLRWVLLHELAHLRRRDPHWQLVIDACCAVYWFNPLVWIARRSLLTEQEIACDDVVVGQSVLRSEYSRFLLETARRALAVPSAPVPAALPLLVGGSSLAQRIRSLLSPDLDGSSSSRSSVRTAALLACTILLLLGAATLPAIGLARASDRTVTLDAPEALDDFLAPLVAEQMTQHGIVGAALSIVKDGKVFLAKGYGHTDLEHSRPVDPGRTIFRIGSISKVFTAVAALQLVDQGRLDLDADVNTYLESFAVDDRFPQPVRLRHLLTHTAGFDQLGIGRHVESREEERPLAEFLAQNLVRVRPPGQVTCYDTYGVTLAGYLAELASGLPYEEYLRRNVLEPLGMARSGIHVADGFLADVAVGYAEDPPVAQRWEFMNTNPASTINSTAEDMAAFMIMLLQDGENGGKRVLSVESARAMKTRQFSNHPELPGYTFLMFEDLDFGVRAVSHGGSMTGYAALMYLLPRNGIGIFIAANRESGAFTRDVMSALVPKLIESKLVDPAKEQNLPVATEHFTGVYADNAYNHTRPEQGGWERRPFILEADAGGTLWVGSSRCRFVSPLLCRTDDGLPVAFRESSDGTISHMFVRQNTYERLDPDASEAVAGQSLPPDALAVYVGDYRIDPPGISVRVFERGGYLIAQEPGEPPHRLKHAGGERFDDGSLHLKFVVDHGQATGFAVDREGTTRTARRVR